MAKPKTYIIADTHFNHKRIVELAYRPKDYEERIRDSLSILNAEDLLIHLGDVSLGKDAEINEEVFGPLACRKILVLGNHDKNHSSHWYMNHGWDFACRSFVDKFFGWKIMFSHEPSRIPEGVDFNIHGHLHAEIHRVAEFFWSRNERCILVSLENTGYRPLLLEDILPNHNGLKVAK